MRALVAAGKLPPTDKFQTCGFYRTDGNCSFLVLVSSVSDKYYGCERPCFLSDTFYEPQQLSKEPLTQMDVKNVQLEQIKKKKNTDSYLKENK